MQYYAERNGHIKLDEIKISLKQLRQFFLDTYLYFDNKKYFKLAFEGNRSTPPAMVPSPSAFFFKHLGHQNVYPLEEYAHRFDRTAIFTIIEILHDYICVIEDFDIYDKDAAQIEFRNEINKYLACFETGYLLSEKGYIINLPDSGLGKLITKNLPENTSDQVTEQVETAIKMFFRYDSNNEEKRKAINILADILEPYKEDLKSYMNESRKNKPHDAMIFGIVNQYRIRHDDIKQKDEYTKHIWYEWMFHYYLSTVHAVLRLKKEHYK